MTGCHLKFLSTLLLPIWSWVLRCCVAGEAGLNFDLLSVPNNKGAVGSSKKITLGGPDANQRINLVQLAGQGEAQDAGGMEKLKVQEHSIVKRLAVADGGAKDTSSNRDARASNGAKKRFTHQSRSGPKVWDHWGKWSSCTVTCGPGKMTRWRHCVSGGCAAGEKEAQIKTCTLPAC